MGQYVDLHAHFLPGLDDGARSPEAALEMLAALERLGFSTLVATPHQRAELFLPSREAIDAAFHSTRAQANGAFPALTLGVAAENFWDDVFHARVRDGGLPCYPGNKAFLFEVSPPLMPARIETTLFAMRVAGRLPVMAHPERYAAVQADIARAESLGRSAALLVDLGALEGAHGRPAMKTARRLLEEGLGYAATSDMHTAEDERAVAGGIAWVKKRLGPEALDRLLAEHPRRILAGELS